MKKSILLLLTLVHLVGCSSADTTTNTSGLTGDLVGGVLLANDRGALMTNHSGVLVRIEGTSFTGLTDSNGRWVIHDLPSKTYAITFSKEGFYSRHEKSFSFLAGEPVRYREFNNRSDFIVLGPLPKFTVTLDGISMPTKQTIDSTGEVVYTNGFVYAHTSDNTPGGSSAGMYVVASLDPDPQIENTTNSYIVQAGIVLNPSVQDSSVDLSTALSYTLFTPIGKPGDTIYFKAYPIINAILEYDAVAGTHNYIGYTLNGSNVLSGVRQ